MNDRALLSARVEECNTHSLKLDHEPHQEGQPVGNLPSFGVGMSDEEQNKAAMRASQLVDYFRAERELYEALYARTSCFSHKGDADRAKLNWEKAVDILASLIAGRRS